MRMNAFIFLPLLGMSFGLQPIVGYNYGAKQFGRIVEAVKLSLAVTTAFGFLGFLTLYLFAEQLLGFFSADPEYLAVGKNAVTIIVLGLPLIGFNVVATTLFQALGKARPSFLLSLTRQLLFLIPLVIILPSLYGLAGIWAAFPVSDCLAFLLSSLLLFRIYRTFKERTGSSKTGTGSEIAVSNRFE